MKILAAVVGVVLFAAGYMAGGAHANRTWECRAGHQIAAHGFGTMTITHLPAPPTPPKQRHKLALW